MNWKKLKTFNDWKNALKRLQVRGTKAISAKSAKDRRGVKKDLLAYIKNSPNGQIPALDKLDVIAAESVAALGKSSLNDALAEIQSRSAALAGVTLTVAETTKQANAAARVLSLTEVNEALGKATTTVAQLKAIKKNLETHMGGKNLIAKVDAAIKAGAKLKATLNG